MVANRWECGFFCRGRRPLLGPAVRRFNRGRGIFRPGGQTRRRQARVVPPPRMGYAPRDMSSAVTTIAAATELNLRADMTFAARNRWAMADIGGGVRLWALAWALGW